MIWRQRFYRILGIICIGGGLFAFYDYGVFVPFVAKLLIAGAHDPFQAFTVSTSFFLGAGALVWTGIRLVTLRSFSHTWLYVAAFPIVAWLQSLFAIGLIFNMDLLLSQSVVYALLYALITGIAVFVHTHWYTPVSHESMRHVGIEKGGEVSHPLLRVLFVCALIVGLLVLHPEDLSTTLRMLVSPVTMAWEFIR